MRNSALVKARRPRSRSSSRTSQTATWTVRRRPGRVTSHGLIEAGRFVLPCVLGHASISVTKREGDGATPRGRLAVVGGYFRHDRLPVARRFGGLTPISADDGWCDDPVLPAYNRPVHLPFAGSHEIMCRRDHLYDVCLVLDWNFVYRARWRGSAIFLHLAPVDRAPTQGCIGVDRQVMDILLRQMRWHTFVHVVA
jgi:L,D-peptidoglycan transpeptidase YkuD (ErfK/YbiS/YcfS/YnhG family)